MLDDKQSLEYFIDHIEWIARLRWPSPPQASRLTHERDTLLASLPDEHVHFGSRQTKPYLGALSPGCQACMEGTWSCLFINRLCTVNCFFCPQDRSVASEKGPTSEGLNFDDPDAYLDYLERFGFTGVSFSGGEPLLALDKILLLMHKIRQRFGRKIYIWLYTNGSLVNEVNLQKLKEAGLDEIRLNISARGYNLRPVKLARQFLNTVTVEIPVIPEDVEKLKTCLIEMQQIGIDYLNIHQLITSKYNYQNLKARNYTFLRPTAFHEPPLYESEITALELLKFAAEMELSLPINYCSHVYKARFQNRAHRYRAAAYACEDYEQITDAGYIRRLSLKGSSADIAKVVVVLRQNEIQETLWSEAANGTEIMVHGSLLEFLDIEKCTLSLSYFEAELLPRQTSKTVRTVTLNGNAKVFVHKSLRAQPGELTPDGAKCFQTLFIARNDDEDGSTSSDLTLALSEAVTSQDTETLREAKKWEWIASGFPEIS